MTKQKNLRELDPPIQRSCILAWSSASYRGIRNECEQARSWRLLPSSSHKRLGRTCDRGAYAHAIVLDHKQPHEKARSRHRSRRLTALRRRGRVRR